MSFASVLGSLAGSALGGAASSGTFGAWDGGWSTYSSGKSRTKYAAEKAYSLQQRAYLESPSAIREGLERAGINPLLATSAFGNSSAGSGSFAEPSSGSSLSLGFDGEKMLTSKEKRDVVKSESRSAKANADATEMESKARIVEAENALSEASARSLALNGLEIKGTSPAVDLIRRNYIRSLESEGYTSSFGHKVFEDLRSLVPFLPSAEFGSSARQGKFWRASVFK